MDGESSSSSYESTQSRHMQEMSTGTESELLRIVGAQLYLLDGQESVRIGAGDFILILMVQANTPLATVVAQVAEFQWPIGKDAPVLKIANLRYTFAVPGLFYGLILPDSVPREHVQQFESYLRKYCMFDVTPEIAKSAGVSDLRLWSSVGHSVEEAFEEARYWTAVTDDVESYSAKLIRQMQSGSKVAANGILTGGEWAAWRISQGASYVKSNIGHPAASGTGEEMSLRMRKRVEQARRMSAVAKLLSRTVLKGAISATGHVANFLGNAISGTPPVQTFMSNDTRRDVVVASVDAFAQVAEAVETAGKSLAVATSSAGAEIVQRKFGENVGRVAQDGMGAMGNMIDSMWTLNKLGLFMIWRATTASTALAYATRNVAASRSPSSSSGTSAQSSRTMKSSSPGTSPGISPPSANTTIRFCPLGRTVAVSAPMQTDEVLQTAQLFPNSPDRSPRQPQFYTIPTPNIVLSAPGYATNHHASPNSPFQQYTRSGVPPQVQAFFPPVTEASKPQ